MAIPVTNIAILRVLLQLQQNFVGLQGDMRNNAVAWNAMAAAQNPDVATLAGYMTSAATSYSTRLGWVAALQADVANWSKVAAMAGVLGVTAQEFLDTMTPITAVATGLATADLSTYAKIQAACNQILAAVNAPLSLWPE